MLDKSVDIITLGCSKNLVDSERLIRQFELNGFNVHHDPAQLKSKIVVVNTCGFIGDAKEESINMILSMVQRKSEGKIEHLYVMGCLSERYINDLRTEIPEVDKFYGKFNWSELLTDLGLLYNQDNHNDRHLTTPSHYAYLKISEGCNRYCSYCAIPIITGRHKSRSIEDLLNEVRILVSRGVKEFQVIAQELTYYGLDLYKHRALPELIERISDIAGVEWIRLHYAYPADFPFDLLRVMRERPNVCRYLDIALQHIANPVLKAMRRNITASETYNLITRLRDDVPGIHLRTTLMVGHPGETEDCFQELLDFVRHARFERMGAFAYSEEDGTYSAEHFIDGIPEDVKQARLSKLMRLQQNISAQIQQEKVNRILRVIIDRQEGDYFIGRSEFDSPEVDPEVLIKMAKHPNIEIGEFYQVKIESADDFDLYGSLV